MEKRLVRLIFTLVLGIPFCYIVYLVIIILAVPKLLNSGSTIPTYTGFYIQYPNLFGEVSNLQCVTNSRSRADYAYSHHCRFNVNLSNIEQFIRESQLLPQDEECYSMDAPNVGEYRPTASWKPSDLQEGGECYASGQFRVASGAFSDQVFLLYSPTSQLAYMQAND
jgi:hypothetical protein